MIVLRLASATVLLASPLLPVAAQTQATQTIQVRSFAFAPAPIHLAAGKSITLTFVNQSGSGHDFSAKEFFAASRITAGNAPGGEVDLEGHETKSITLVPVAGTYQAHCSHFLHASMGMHTQIIVN